AFRVEDSAVRRFARTRSRFALTARDAAVFSQISRYYLDVATVVGVGFCRVVTWLVGGRGSVLASFGVLVGVGARAMPGLGRCLTSLTQIKVAGAAVLDLEPQLAQVEELSPIPGVDGAAAAASSPRTDRSAVPNDAGEEPPTLISLEHVTFRYPTGHTDAVHDISLALKRGELVAIIGETGAGKTTLVDILVGLLPPSAGVVGREASGAVGYVAQETFAWDDTVRSNIAMDRPPVASDVDGEVWASLEAA